MSLELELILFVIVLAAVIGMSWFGQRWVGLSMSYLISLGFIHFWGGLIHSLSWYHGGEADFTQLGFEQFTWGVAAFAVGCIGVSPLIAKRLPARDRSIAPRALTKAAIIAGIILYGFLRSVLSNVPSIGALTTCGGGLLLAGLCLYVWNCLNERRWWGLFFIFASLAFLPFFTIISAGFLGYGAAAALVVMAFLSCQLKWRIVSVILLFSTIYFGFCTFMTYMRDRSDIRDEMWDEDSSFSQRFDRLKKTFTDFEKVDFTDQEQLERIEGRLNQNDLVGRAVTMLDAGSVNFANGETFQQAAISIVPRIFWPDKPVTAGSPDIVSYFTGVGFAAGTSVGIGQVMEGYVNFGTPGVIGLFLVFGAALGVMDSRAGQRLRMGDTLGFVVWFVPGIAMLQPGGSLVDVGCTVAASIVLVYFFKTPFVLQARKAIAQQRDASAAELFGSDMSAGNLMPNPINETQMP